MSAEMKERARKWLSARGVDAWVTHHADDLAALLAEVLTERLPCGHLAGELRDGACAGCEREARIRAEVVEEAGAVADRVARTNSKLSREMEDHDLLEGCTRHRAIATTVEEVARQIRILAPGDYVALRREDLEWLLSEAETCEVRMPTSSPTLNAQYAERFQRVRAALARKEIP